MSHHDSESIIMTHDVLNLTHDDFWWLMIANFSQNFPTAATLSNFSETFQLQKKLSNFARFFPTSIGSFQLR